MKNEGKDIASKDVLLTCGIQMHEIDSRAHCVRLGMRLMYSMLSVYYLGSNSLQGIKH